MQEVQPPRGVREGDAGGQLARALRRRRRRGEEQLRRGAADPQPESHAGNSCEPHIQYKGREG